MTEGKTYIHISKPLMSEATPFGDRFLLYLFRRKDGVGEQAAVTWTKADMLATDPPPTLSLRPDEAQELFQKMWNTGYRPDCELPASAKEALERHLSDMRRLVFEGKP